MDRVLEDVGGSIPGAIARRTRRSFTDRVLEGVGGCPGASGPSDKAKLHRSCARRRRGLDPGRGRFSIDHVRRAGPAAAAKLFD